MDLLNPAIVGMLMFLLSVVWMLRDESDKSRPILAIAVLLNLFYGWLLSVLMGHADSLLPWKYDYYLYRIDSALGVSAASVALTFGGAGCVWLNITYELLLPMMIVWLALQSEKDRIALVFAYIAEIVTGPVLYAILPACGPPCAFGESWLQPQHVHAELIRVSGMPNAFPSLHVATAFVLVLFARDRIWRVISLVFLAGTTLSTLTTGEHYVIDLVAGLSFGCFATAVGRRKVSQAAAYLAITVCWSLVIRLGGEELAAHSGGLQAFALFSVAIAIGALWQAWQATLRFEPVPTGEGTGVSSSKELAG
jgi:hypothetical protein